MQRPPVWGEALEACGPPAPHYVAQGSLWPGCKSITSLCINLTKPRGPVNTQVSGSHFRVVCSKEKPWFEELGLNNPTRFLLSLLPNPQTQPAAAIQNFLDSRTHAQFLLYCLPDTLGLILQDQHEGLLPGSLAHQASSDTFPCLPHTQNPVQWSELTLPRREVAGSGPCHCRAAGMGLGGSPSAPP